MTALQNVSAAALGAVAPEKDKAGVVAGLMGTQIAVDSRDSELPNQQLQAVDELGAREFKDLQRRFEAAGWALHPLHDESLVACRWGLTKVLVGIGAARRFLAMVGGAHAV
jgi:hypothetical protein